jgi:hypothetical protein
MTHVETFEADGAYWGDLANSNVVPKKTWVDLYFTEVSWWGFLSLSLARAAIGSGGGTLDTIFDEDIGPLGGRLRLAPSWQLGLWPTCQVWVIADNPDGRPFWVQSYGVRVTWEGETLTLAAEHPLSKTSDRTTLDMGRAPEPCFVRLFVGEHSAGVNVWPLGETEPTGKWMLQMGIRHPDIGPPTVLLDLGIFGTIFWRWWPADGTEVVNLPSIIGVTPPALGSTFAPIAISSMLLEQAAGSLDLAETPVTDITELPQRTWLKYDYKRPDEHCWGFEFVFDTTPRASTAYQVGGQAYGTFYRQEEAQRAAVGGFSMAKGVYNLEYALFYWWKWNGTLKTSQFVTSSIPLMVTEEGAKFRLYEPYVRSDDGWWIFWSPCLLGGVPRHQNPYSPYFDDFGHPGETSNSTEGPHAMWKDSSFPVLCLPSKYVSGFDFEFHLHLFTYQDFTIILGELEGPYVDYAIDIWYLCSDRPQLGDADVGADGLPKGRVFIARNIAVGVGVKTVEAHVDFDPDPDKRKVYFMYGFSWSATCDTTDKAAIFGPRGGVLFGPPWIRATVTSESSKIVMRWEKPAPEKTESGQEIFPETTILPGPADDTYWDKTTVDGKTVYAKVKVPFSPEHGWCEETLAVRNIKTKVTTVIDGEWEWRGGQKVGPLVEVTEGKRRVFRLTRAASAGTLSAWANSNRLVYGLVDPDKWNDKYKAEIAAGTVKKADNDYWPLVDDSSESNKTFSDGAGAASPNEPRTYALRKGLFATAITAHYSITEYQEARGDQRHRQRDSTVTNADRAKRGMIRGYQ